jgi:hypothetical protein
MYFIGLKGYNLTFGSDMSDAVGPQIKPFLSGDWVESFFKQARSTRGLTAATKEVAKWSKAMVKKALMAA